MCLSAIYWARINKIYYANTRSDAQKIDFSDAMIYEELNKTIKDTKNSYASNNERRSFESI